MPIYRPIRVQRSPDGGPLSAEGKAVFLQGTLDRSLDVRVFSGEEVLNGSLQLEPEAIVIGSVEVLHAHWRQHDCPIPEDIDYPEPLRPFLKREVQPKTLGEARREPHCVFVKPQRGKAFDAGVLDPAVSSEHWPGAGWPDSTPVWTSSVFDPHAEYRVYVHQGRMRGAVRYDPNDTPPPGALDMSVIMEAIEAWRCSEEDPMPAGCALDFAVDGEGDTVLVEATDGWAIGFYSGFDPREYLRLVAARQAQITGHSLPVS
ncbi:ATP-grasp domain-containing protein [Thioalkalivibrio sp. ALE19]|uniref:ATP-grasp domain-containing protein n=1 Tax=Thioalkalivibrio sp. ALE19 TaxID=1266909 RepID=UPI0003FA1CE3|nr:ATP-grasp domain-containing protein [Thioalkalivibrio sp. ALE19]